MMPRETFSAEVTMGASMMATVGSIVGSSVGGVVNSTSMTSVVGDCVVVGIELGCKVSISDEGKSVGFEDGSRDALSVGGFEGSRVGG
jgi:hypothetical protein